MTQRSTKEMYTNSQGLYIEERQILHKEIATQLLKGIHRQESPEIIFMGGGTAVGKSTVRQKYIHTYAANGGIAVIDCDDIKDYIPEYEKLKESDVTTAANLVHQESGDIAMFALQLALNEQMHVIFDATMKDAEWYEELIGYVKNMGYSVIAVIVHAPLHIAIEREALRAKKTQRVVPKEDLVLSHNMVQDSFVSLKNKFDAYVIWDNSKPNFGEPAVIEEFIPPMKESNVLDWEKYAEFYSKKE